MNVNDRLTIPVTSNCGWVPGFAGPTEGVVQVGWQFLAGQEGQIVITSAPGNYVHRNILKVDHATTPFERFAQQNICVAPLLTSNACN